MTALPGPHQGRLRCRRAVAYYDFRRTRLLVAARRLRRPRASAVGMYVDKRVGDAGPTVFTTFPAKQPVLQRAPVVLRHRRGESGASRRRRRGRPHRRVLLRWRVARSLYDGGYGMRLRRGGRSLCLVWGCFHWPASGAGLLLGCFGGAAESFRLRRHRWRLSGRRRRPGHRLARHRGVAGCGDLGSAGRGFRAGQPRVCRRGLVRAPFWLPRRPSSRAGAVHLRR